MPLLPGEPYCSASAASSRSTSAVSRSRSSSGNVRGVGQPGFERPPDLEVRRELPGAAARHPPHALGHQLVDALAQVNHDAPPCSRLRAAASSALITNSFATRLPTSSRSSSTHRSSIRSNSSSQRRGPLLHGDGLPSACCSVDVHVGLGGGDVAVDVDELVVEEVVACAPSCTVEVDRRRHDRVVDRGAVEQAPHPRIVAVGIVRRDRLGGRGAPTARGRRCANVRPPARGDPRTRPAATQSAAGSASSGRCVMSEYVVHPGVVAVDVDELGAEEVGRRGKCSTPEMNSMSSSASVNSRGPVRGAERRREAVTDRVVVAQVDAEGVLHHQVVDLGAVEQPLHRRVVGRGRAVTPVGAHVGSPPRRVITHRPSRRVEVFDVAAAAHVELVRHAVRAVPMVREHRVGVDVRGVAVDLDELVARTCASWCGSGRRR